MRMLSGILCLLVADAAIAGSSTPEAKNSPPPAALDRDISKPIGTESPTGTVPSQSQSTAIQHNTWLQGYPGVYGTGWYTQGHSNWNIVQTSRPYNPTEWQIYSSAAQGIARTIAGTSQVVRIRGTPFDAAWVSHPYFYWEGSGYKVTSVVDADHLTVQKTDGGPVTWGATTNGTFYYVVTSVTNTCNVSDNNISFIVGEPFIPFFDSVYVNGSPVTAYFKDPTHMTLSSYLGPLTRATCQQLGAIGQGGGELSTLRLQGLAGKDEENFTISETPAGTYLQSAYAGYGKYRPIFFGTGENPMGTFNPLIALYPASKLGNGGLVSIGGSSTTASLIVDQNSVNVNYLRASGAASHAAPSIAAGGLGSDVNIALLPKGTGVIQAGGPVQLPSYTVAELPACTSANRYSIAVASDIITVAYGATPSGGGSAAAPVFCDGSRWTIH